VVEQESQTDTETCLHFRIRDTGIGIPLEKQSLVFGAFSQADGSTTRKYGGTGLGLAITSQLVQRMGGRIWIESPATTTPGAAEPGSVFHFTATLGRVSDGEARPPSPELRGVRVLVVDDNATNRRLLEETLRSWQMRPFAVRGGAEALAELSRVTETRPAFGIVLIDASLPGLDAFALAQQLRATPRDSGSPIMMLSPARRSAQSARCRTLGLDTYLNKPVRRSDLLAAIESALRGADEKSSVKDKTPVATSSDERSLRVLLAEDNLVNQRLAVRVLEKGGHTVEVAANGQQAVELFMRQRFDVVLMDVEMPDMNGFDATRVIRDSERPIGRHTPIVAMTAHALKGDRERCLAAGMDDYISKPIRGAELLQTIRRHIPATDHEDHAYIQPRDDRP
jgi:CheY-like chemotaxis protein